MSARRSACTLCFLLLLGCGLLRTASAQSPMPARMQATPLADLLAEAVRNNPALRAARLAAEVRQASIPAAQALPDTRVTVQQFAVGSPKPFAGFSNSDFAYIGFGVEQQIPYPGKRKLRAEVVRHAADADRQDVTAAERQILETVRVDYFQLAGLQQSLAILRQNRDTLATIAQAAEAQYRVGKGNQQDVLKAQIERTRLLAEVADHHRRMGEIEAQLKQALHRPQQSPDIVAQPLQEARLTASLPDLLDRVASANPLIAGRRALEAADQSQVALARRDFKPDFNVQYMWQHTASQFRDYYMATVSMNLPNRGRRRAELAQATAQLREAQAGLAAELDAQRAEVSRQFAIARNASEQIRILDQGLTPEAEANFRSALNAYESARADFETVMNAFLDLQKLQMDRQHQLADFASALARLEALTGEPLP